MKPLPTVSTLVPAGQLGVGPLPSAGVRLLVFRRWSDGRVEVDGFPAETDVCEDLAAHMDPNVVRLERGRLYVTAANGHAVYVSVGPSPLRGCVRYGRLYLRQPGNGQRAGGGQRAVS